MGWSEVVHHNRKQVELSRAREELRIRRRGYDVELGPDVTMPTLMTLVGVLSGAVWWRKEGRKVQGRDWQDIPGLQQLLELLNLRPKQTRSTVRSKVKPKQSAKAAVVSKAAAASAARAESSSKNQQASAPPIVHWQVSWHLWIEDVHIIVCSNCISQWVGC